MKMKKQIAKLLIVVMMFMMIDFNCITVKAELTGHFYEYINAYHTIDGNGNVTMKVIQELPDMAAPANNGLVSVSFNMIYKGETHTLNTVTKGDITSSADGVSFVYNLKDMIQQFGLPYASANSSDTTIEFQFSAWTYVSGMQYGPSYSADNESFSFDYSQYINPVTTVTVPNCNAGSAPTPTVSFSILGNTYTLSTTASNGFYYDVRYYPINQATPSDTVYSASNPPTAAGDYRADVTVYSTTSSTALSTASKEFTISKQDIDASIAIESVIYPAAIAPVIGGTGRTNAEEPYVLYAISGTDAFDEVAPTAPGEYTAKVVFQENAYYNEASSTCNFTISRGNIAASISVNNVTTGVTPSPVIGGGSVVNAPAPVTYYKVKGADDSTYTTTVPIKEGTYTAKVVFAENAYYFAASATCDFSITKMAGKASFSVASFVYGESKVTPKVSSDTNSASDAVIKYKESTAADSTYTTTAPVKPGKYTAQVTLPSNDKYQEVVLTYDFEIFKAEGNASISLKNLYFGMKVNPVISTTKKDAAEPYVLYKEKGADDSTYSVNVPKQPGEYVAKVVYPENDYYKLASATVDFAISYMPTPKWSMTGTEGSNGFFKSNVTISSVDGILVATSPLGPFTTQVILNDNTEIKELFFKDSETGALSAAVPFVTPSIDTIKPFIKNAPEGGAVCYSNLYEFSVADSNLESININGQDIDFSGNSYTLLFDPQGGSMEYTVIITDKAGNVTTLRFTVEALWLMEGVIPEGEVIRLQPGMSYELGDESDGWMIEGEDTVYCASTVYVNTDQTVFFVKAGQ